MAGRQTFSSNAHPPSRLCPPHIRPCLPYRLLGFEDIRLLTPVGPAEDSCLQVSAPCRAHKKRELRIRRSSLQTYSRRRATLPRSRPRSTIAAGGLNCCVRNGNRCGPSAITTGKIFILQVSEGWAFFATRAFLKRGKACQVLVCFWKMMPIMVKPHGLLVPVS